MPFDKGYHKDNPNASYMKKLMFRTFLILFATSVSAQHQISIEAVLDEKRNLLEIEQAIHFQNNSPDTLHVIYLNDWTNAFSSKSSPLAQRFSEDYQRNFHFSKEEERGFTTIKSISSKKNGPISWKRKEGQVDILRLVLKEPLMPSDSIALHLNYQAKISSSKFTGYGFSENAYKLRYWFLIPTVYDGKWQTHSHKNLGDMFVPLSDLQVSVKLPLEYRIVSPLDFVSLEYSDNRKTIHLQSENQQDFRLYLERIDARNFEVFETQNLNLVTNVMGEKLSHDQKQLVVGRILGFLEQRLGNYPHEELLVTQEDYTENPVYGLNQLPNFIRPFPDTFQYDIKQIKAITGKYLRNSLLLNPRNEKWIIDAMQVFLMMEYVDTYYPDMKLLGTLSDIFGIEWFHLADMDFNDQYSFLFMHMQRLNLDQPLSTSQDSLIKFNVQIANDYKAGVGLAYLKDFLQNDAVQKTMREFYQNFRLQPVHAQDFENLLETNAEKDISWFFEDYIATNTNIDFNIKKVEKAKDSLLVTIKNKEDNGMPVSVYGLKNDSIVFKKWVEKIHGTKTVAVPRENVERVALNYEQTIPEFNQRDNYHRVTTLFDKPFQFRLLLDREDPRYHQVFLMPEFSYNLYDGISIGPKLYNKTLLTKDFVYSISPKIGLKNQALIGSLSFYNTHRYKNQEFHSLKYGMSATRYSYAEDFFYYKFSPNISFNFRNLDLRDNEEQTIFLRGVSVIREGPTELQDEPDYNVLNLGYNYSNQNMINYFTTSLDYQYSEDFSKIAVTATYRQLFDNNRQINLRLFAGTFIHNDTKGSDFFSFALDRPSDYLFDYNYYGRSESSGLFSQQYIRAEGGFKSKLQPAFANQWITALNASTNLWKWIFVYGDVGLVKNENISPQFMYDSGVRLSLVEDYFEVFFPVYSNLGWEIDQPDYDQKIRFIVSLDIQTLIKLFTRRWY